MSTNSTVSSTDVILFRNLANQEKLDLLKNTDYNKNTDGLEIPQTLVNSENENDSDNDSRSESRSKSRSKLKSKSREQISRHHKHHNRADKKSRSKTGSESSDSESEKESNHNPRHNNDDNRRNPFSRYPHQHPQSHPQSYPSENPHYLSTSNENIIPAYFENQRPNEKSSHKHNNISVFDQETFKYLGKPKISKHNDLNGMNLQTPVRNDRSDHDESEEDSERSERSERSESDDKDKLKKHKHKHKHKHGRERENHIHERHKGGHNGHERHQSIYNGQENLHFKTGPGVTETTNRDKKEERRDQKSENDPITRQEKTKYLLQLEKLRLQGTRLTRVYTMDDSLADIRFEYDSHQANHEAVECINNMKEYMKWGFLGVEGLSFKFGLLKLNGWSNYMSEKENMDKFNRPLERVYHRYWRQSQPSIAYDFLMTIVGSMIMFHVQNSYFGGMNIARSVGGFSNIFGGQQQQQQNGGGNGGGGFSLGNILGRFLGGVGGGGRGNNENNNTSPNLNTNNSRPVNRGPQTSPIMPVASTTTFRNSNNYQQSSITPQRPFHTPQQTNSMMAPGQNSTFQRFNPQQSSQQPQQQSQQSSQPQQQSQQPSQPQQQPQQHRETGPELHSFPPTDIVASLPVMNFQRPSNNSENENVGENKNNEINSELKRSTILRRPLRRPSANNLSNISRLLSPVHETNENDEGE